jgi:hypothetical protein
VNARHRQRRRCVDRFDFRVGDGASEDRGVPLPVAPNVVDVFATPAQKAEILDALDRRADVGIASAQFGCQRTGTSW